MEMYQKAAYLPRRKRRGVSGQLAYAVHLPPGFPEDTFCSDYADAAMLICYIGKKLLANASYLHKNDAATRPPSGGC